MIFLLAPEWITQGLAQLSSTTTKLVTSLAETNSPNALLANLTQLLEDQNRMQKPNTSQIHYELLDLNVNLLGPSRLQSSHAAKLSNPDGLIYLNIPLDRERLCPEVHSTNLPCSINMLIAHRQESIQSVDHVTYIDLTVVVIDINDNVPYFKSQLHSRFQILRLKEECPIGSMISIPRAVDIDSLDYGIRRYDFHPTSTPLKVIQHFQIVNLFDSDAKCETVELETLSRSSNSLGTSVTPCLQVIQRIDREVLSEFRFRIQAIDTDQNKGEVELQVLIEDINDHKPTWASALLFFNSDGQPGKVHALNVQSHRNTTHSRYTFPLKECTTQSRLVHLKATDLDEPGSMNSRVTYDLSPDMRMEELERVRIMNDYLCLVGSGLKHLNAENLTVFVLAKDGGGLENEAEFVFPIEDCNNNEPVILMKQNIFNIEENLSGAPSLLGLITVRDGDKINSHNSVFDCLLNDTTYLNLRKVATGPVEYPLLDKHPISNELIADPTQTGRWSIYHLETLPNVPFDRETMDQYTVSLECTDRGIPPLSSNRTILINIQDVNDNRPQFIPTRAAGRNPHRAYQSEAILLKSPQTFEFSIDENSGRGTLIGRLFARDLDLKENAKVTFELMKSFENQSVITISPNGEIFLARELDRELRDRYRFVVTVKDHGSPIQLSSTAELILHVLDVNDCTPEFHGEYIYEVVESYASAPVHHVLGYLNATDCDLGQNGSIRYKLANTHSQMYLGQEDRVTGIRDPQTAKLLQVGVDGKLTIYGVVDRERTPVLMIDVMAQDDGVPNRLYSVTTVTIHVLDLNDNKPRLLEPTLYPVAKHMERRNRDSLHAGAHSSLNLSLETSVGTQLIKLNAVDPDAGENGTVYFELLSPERSTWDAAENTSISAFTLQADGLLILTSPLKIDHIHPQSRDRSSIQYRRPDRLLIKISDRGHVPEQLVTVLHIQYYDPMLTERRIHSAHPSISPPTNYTLFKQQIDMQDEFVKESIRERKPMFTLPILYLLALAICFSLLVIVCSLVFVYFKTKGHRVPDKNFEESPKKPCEAGRRVGSPRSFDGNATSSNANDTHSHLDETCMYDTSFTLPYPDRINDESAVNRTDTFQKTESCFWSNDIHRNVYNSDSQDYTLLIKEQHPSHHESVGLRHVFMTPMVEHCPHQWNHQKRHVPVKTAGIKVESLEPVYKSAIGNDLSMNEL